MPELQPDARKRESRDYRRLLGLAEPPRAALETLSLLAAQPLLPLAARGDGHEVIVIPGFGGDDTSTAVLREFLWAQGFRARRWGMGRNLGIGSLQGYSRLVDLVAALHSDSGRRVSLVGWSLGGVHARMVARIAPHAVRQVISLGSPLRARAALARHQPPEGIPATAIYSRTDGVVPWRIAMEQPGPLTDNIEVFGSHLGLGVNPAVLYAVADRLALPEDGWQPFRREGWRQWVFGEARAD